MGIETIASDRLAVLIYLVLVAVLLSAVAVTLSAWCVVMLRRVHRAETPWQREVSEKLFPSAEAPAAPAIPARQPLAPLPDYAATTRGSVPSEEPPPVAQTRTTLLPRRRR